jgi:flagellar biosynthesis/type III secretory pathway protein FliH
MESTEHEDQKERKIERLKAYQDGVKDGVTRGFDQGAVTIIKHLRRKMEEEGCNAISLTEIQKLEDELGKKLEKE